MADRQWMTPDGWVINEEGEEEYMLPSGEVISEDQAAAPPAGGPPSGSMALMGVGI